jgi:hypothetical protein
MPLVNSVTSGSTRYTGMSFRRDRKGRTFSGIMTTDDSITEADDAVVGRLRRAAYSIRQRVLEHTIANGGYLSQACSSAEILAVLYLHVMRLGPSQAPRIPSRFGKDDVPCAANPHPVHGAVYNGPNSPELDRFFLSPTHYALALYATLIESGRLGSDGLRHFNQDGSSVEMIGGEHSPGHEVNGGSFGQALSQAAGVAVAHASRGIADTCGFSCRTANFRKVRLGKPS